jgi:hypothetical protein
MIVCPTNNAIKEAAVMLVQRNNKTLKVSLPNAGLPNNVTVLFKEHIILPSYANHIG